MPKYGFLVVEGPHDVEFAARLLKPLGFSRVKMLEEVDPILRALIPREYPPGGDIQKRMGTPLFVRSTSHILAIHSATGDSRLVGTIEENVLVVEKAQLTGMGLLFDADKEKADSAAVRYAAVKGRMDDIGLTLPNEAGRVTDTTPRLGAFVLPDNVSSGTLEDVLLECAHQQYPTLLGSASAHVEKAGKDGTLIADDTRDFKKPSGQNKATVSSIAAILRPGKAVQVSIQDNRWLGAECLALPRVKAVQDFLRQLFEIP